MTPTMPLGTETLELSPDRKKTWEIQNLTIRHAETFPEYLTIDAEEDIWRAYRPLSLIIFEKLVQKGQYGQPQDEFTKLHKLLNKWFPRTNHTGTLVFDLDLGSFLSGSQCTVRRESEVKAFLMDNKHLIHYIWEACRKIQQYFGVQAKIALEVVTDPEDSNSKELVIFVRTSLLPKNAFERLQKLDDDWWLDVPASVRKLACINLEFE